MILISYLFISDPSFHFGGSWLTLSRGRGGERYLTIFSDFCVNVVLRGTRPLDSCDDRVSRLCINHHDQYRDRFVSAYQGLPGTSRHVSAG